MFKLFIKRLMCKYIDHNFYPVIEPGPLRKIQCDCGARGYKSVNEFGQPYWEIHYPDKKEFEVIPDLGVL